MEEPSSDSALAAPAFGYVEFGVAHGLPRDELMAAAQLREELRADPDARCSQLSYVILWKELITRLPDVVVPVELVRAMQPASLGVTAQVVLRADNLAHAGALTERFLQLSDTAMTLTWHERGDRVGFSIGHRPEVVAMRFPIELMLGVGFRLMSFASGGVVPFSEVTFAHAAGYPVAAYEQFYRIARGSALECAAVLDALHALELVTREEVEPVEELLVRIVAMLTKMAAR